MADGMLSLSWNNHSSTFCHMLSQLRHKEKYSDATVACEGRFYPVHKLVLSTCSQYFEDMFEHVIGKHPIVLLHDVRRDELEALLSYMYAGIVSVAQRDLARLIKVAELLQIKGLAVPDEIPTDKKNVRNNLSLSSERTSPRPKVAHGVESSDDRTSPHPKRRRREDNAMPSQGGSSPIRVPDSPRPSSHTKDSNQMQEDSEIKYEMQEENIENVNPRVEIVEQSTCDIRDHTERTNTSKTEQRGEHQVNQRLQHQPGSQEPSGNQYKDGTDDAIVIKEETWEDPGDNQINSMTTSLGFGPSSDEMSSSAIDGAQEDHAKLLLSKEYESHLPQALPEVVVEALAGPSGMHEWLGGGDFTAGLAGVENYSGEGSPPTADHPLQHQLVMIDGDGDGSPAKPFRLVEMPGVKTGVTKTIGLVEAQEAQVTQDPSINFMAPKIHYCPYCAFTTSITAKLTEHLRIHANKNLFPCPHCPFQAEQVDSIRTHIRTHTGEKPFACAHCSYRSAQKGNVKRHVLNHHLQSDRLMVNKSLSKMQLNL
ncbi:protein tramtrack, beta isoform isoform X2 [Cherax quadricarinatus]|uniref:protein tramtrack, beta isoform isoform X2 n=1 Tax=Cherax quadricarinatus TaxID=27406 RepID=UPI0023793925|nr:protein tramtrack, beta isoform-like isoform X1 [Cherax quadricarinatus]XP_053628360.1 protein tramtrack, beta isoform-like isoform X1 [Cherax quadricarinatus]XP_053628361.1 protein tramtrack, beta isoform-like isoform X1 [Cherax quadricarinatus]